jgi:hypothetical protein
LSVWTQFFHIVSLSALLLCGAAYCYAYVYKPKALRLTHAASLCFTGMAMMEMLIFMGGNGGRLNAEYGMAFLVLSGLAQASMALRGRAGGQTRTGEGQAR